MTTNNSGPVGAFMIPVRVPADAPTYLAADDQTLTPDHRLHGQPCPVCTEQLGAGPIALVYVGMAPERRAAGRAHDTGAAVAIHSACRAPGAVHPH